MKKKKLFYNLIICCFSFVFINTLVGCSTPNKKDKILSVQKHRIQSLEKEVSRQKKLIEKLKVQKWTRPKVSGFQQELNNLKALMKQKNYVKALKKSSVLKKKKPRSVTLRKIRVEIFNKMNLKQQAAAELKAINKLTTMRKNRSRQRVR